jgi:histone deacetylase complex regulatory component SIN3
MGLGSNGNDPEAWPEEWPALLTKIKHRFYGLPAYREFLDIMVIMGQYTSRAPDAQDAVCGDAGGVLERAKSLFKNDHDLLAGFQELLPPAFKICLLQARGGAVNADNAANAANAVNEVNEVVPLPWVGDARVFVSQVRSRFHDDPAAFAEFLDIMTGPETDTVAVVERVRRLFYGEDDLLAGFSVFVPPGFAMAAAPAGLGLADASAPASASSSPPSALSYSPPPTSSSPSPSSSSSSSDSSTAVRASRNTAAEALLGIGVPAGSTTDVKE